jgi:hypothetical protein
MHEHEESFEIGETPMNTQEISPLHYGNENSPISYGKQLASGELNLEVVKSAVEIIQSNECMVSIHEHDDGCIDGRCTGTVSYFKNGEEVTVVADNSNHERYKVAGGGYVTGAAMTLALGSESRQTTLDTQIAYTAALLNEKGIVSGMHTADVHGNATGTGCGANDQLPTILRNGSVYAEQISANLKALLAVADIPFNPQVFNRDVLESWNEAIEANGFAESSTGVSRLSEMKKAIQTAQAESGTDTPVAVSKHLLADHKEDFIILNYVEGKTFSQNVFMKKLAATQDVDPTSDEAKAIAQAFVVDVPRIVELARAVSTDAAGAVNDTQFEKALYAGVAYQLATAATLTDGSLRMFIVS